MLHNVVRVLHCVTVCLFYCRKFFVLYLNIVSVHGGEILARFVELFLFRLLRGNCTVSPCFLLFLIQVSLCHEYVNLTSSLLCTHLLYCGCCTVIVPDHRVVLLLAALALDNHSHHLIILLLRSHAYHLGPTFRPTPNCISSDPS